MNIRSGLIVAAAAGVVLFAGGCNSMNTTSTHVHVLPSLDNAPMDADAVAAANRSNPDGRLAFAFGAGDALGGTLFERHVAFVNAAYALKQERARQGGDAAEPSSASVPVTP